MIPLRTTARYRGYRYISKDHYDREGQKSVLLFRLHHEQRIQALRKYYEDIGFDWHWKGEGWKEKQRRWRGVVAREGARQPVICHETGQIFPAVTAAVEWVKTQCPKAHHSGILSAMRNGHSAYGYHWRYPGEEPYFSPQQKKVPVMLLETGQVYPSLYAAARARAQETGQKWQTICENIRRAIAKNKADRYGYHWKIVDANMDGQCPAAAESRPGAAERSLSAS
jgi:hypothetical protein